MYLRISLPARAYLGWSPRGSPGASCADMKVCLMRSLPGGLPSTETWCELGSLLTLLPDLRLNRLQVPITIYNQRSIVPILTRPPGLKEVTYVDYLHLLLLVFIMPNVPLCYVKILYVAESLL